MNAVIRSNQRADPAPSVSIGSSKPGLDLQDQLVKIRKEIVELLSLLKAL
ncbi:MAG: hypothetical protein ABIS36_10000 [Chryseolinea sp.]